MKKVLNNKLLMFWAVLDVLAKFNALWAAVAGFVAAHGEFDVAVKAIKKTSNASGTKTGEVTKDKNQSLTGFAELVFRVISLVSVFATNTNNAALKALVDYSEGELKDMRPGELLSFSEDVLEIVNANKTGLTPLGLAEADVDRIIDFIENFETITSSTRTTITARKTAGGRLRPQFAAASFVLREKIDKLMEQFRESNPDFYDEYWNAREKVDYGIRHEDEPTTTQNQA